MSYLLLLAHLIGDYVLQSHVMAMRKTSSWRWALIHAAFYSLPFAALLAWLGAPLDAAALALAIIGGTHAVIDRLRLAARWCQWYGVGHPGIWFRAVRWFWTTFDQGEYSERDISPEPLFEAPPPFLGVWLTIIVDNTIHLAINGAAFTLLAPAAL